MSNFTEYEKYDALGLAELVAKKEVTPAELCEEAIARIDRGNPSINAVVYKMYDIAREAAAGELPDGPFKGVPFLLKDLLAAFAGVPMTSGCKAYRNYVPDHDSELVRRFRKTGLNVVGKTNTPEFGLMGVTEPELFGPCRNPWNTERTPGGSSGGSAAAVAAGIVPMASGGDGGGSIRIPSSHCGLFGLKPARGRNPLGPDYGEIWQGAVVEHVLSRSVRDSAAALDATNGADPGAPYGIAPPECSYLADVGREPGKLRIAFDTASPIGKPVHTECVAAVKNAAKLLESLGHRVEEARPKIDGRAVAISYLTMCCGEVAADIAKIEKEFGAKAAREDVELGSRMLGLLGRTITAGEFVAAIREWDKAARAMGAFFEDYDIYVTPTVARPPVKIGELALKPAEQAIASFMNALGAGNILKSAGMVEKIGIENLAAMPFTQLGNVAGLPAMSVPLHWTADGLPCGVQFAARFGAESVLFRLAGQLEQAAPWFDKRPSE
ncbi:MAG: amidase [bacterium]